MGRLRKGVSMLEKYVDAGLTVFGEKVGDRYELVDWLNQALQGPARDRHAAERVGSLIGGMNDAAMVYSRSYQEYTRWRFSGTKEANWGSPVPESARIHIRSLRGISSSYKPEFDLLPSSEGDKWEFMFHCDAPSGDGSKILARWPGESDENPESQAVEAVVLIAVNGRLGTLKRCQIGSCGKWFITKDDPRIRWCPDHDTDDFRKGTPERKKQVNAAAKRARDRAKIEEQKHWRRSRANQFLKPGTRRAKD